jgi:hypothetical protein
MYCDVGFDEIDDLEEANEVIEAYTNTLEVLKKGYHILPAKIISIINMYLDENACFCKIKKEAWRWRWQKEWNCSVTLYTSNMLTLEDFIQKVSGIYFGIRYSGSNEEYPYVLPNKEYFKISIRYKKLIPFLIKALEEIRDELIDYRNEHLEIG